MKENTQLLIVKVIVSGLIIAILVLSAFGAGFALGARSPMNTQAGRELPERPVASPAPALAAESPTAPASLPTEEAQAKEGLAPPTPTPQPAPPTPTARPTPTAAGSAQKPAEPLTLDTALFQEVLDLLQKQFYGDLPQGKEVTYDAIRGLVERLGDPNTAFLDPKAAAFTNERMEGQYEGIGALVEKAEGGGVLLKYLYPGQPAEKAGLRVGDVITGVDGQDITKLSLEEAIGLIRGPRGTKVRLTVNRGKEPPFDVTIERARIEIPIVETKTLSNGEIEYVALSTFSSQSSRRVAEAVSAALAKKPKGLVLDLRGNPGGLLDAAVRIGSIFVPEGNILLERTKDGTERAYGREGRYLLGTTPLVVLVDGGSASASEIVAGAIQDAGTGKLIGEKTYGKGSVQIPNALSDGSQLRVTIARWFTPKGRGIHGTGLQPDIVVPITEEDVAAQKDPQLDRAVEYLLTGK